MASSNSASSRLKISSSSDEAPYIDAMATLRASTYCSREAFKAWSSRLPSSAAARRLSASLASSKARVLASHEVARDASAFALVCMRWRRPR